jgi:hypothetical protein
MGPVVNRFAASFAVILIVVLSIPAPASAITVELAKQCRGMALKTHPTALAGSKTGTARAQRDYYLKCIANNGTMPADDAQSAPPPAAK